MRRRRSYTADNIAAEYRKRKAYSEKKRKQCMIDKNRNCKECIYSDVCEEKENLKVMF